MDKCSKCGCCCVIVNENNDFRVKLIESDMQLSSPDIDDLLLELNDKVYLKAKWMNGLKVCVALEGEIGRDARCSIHERKPHLCRMYPPSRTRCKMTRDRVEHKLSKLENSE